MEPPVRVDSESVRDEKVKILKAIPELNGSNVVRGQFRGYQEQKGVAPGSRMETFAAVRLEVDSWRWHGVPFYIRAGKCLPVTCTEIVCRLRKPPGILPGDGFGSNYMRFRISPDVAIAMGMTVMSPGDSLQGEPVEMVASRQPGTEEMDAYERVLRDAMAGDATLFAREDYVEEAWRIVDPLLKEETPVYQYDPGEWGPEEVERLLPPGGWVNPIVNDDASQHRTQEELVLQ